MRLGGWLAVLAAAGAVSGGQAGAHEVCRAAQGGRAAADEGAARVYPPAPQVDFTHLKLDLRFDDPARRRFEATETLTFTTLALPISALRLHGVDLALRDVRADDGADLATSYDDRVLTIHFDPPLGPGTPAEVVIRYACDNPAAGMIFAVPDAGYPDRPLQVHTQGQAEFNRHWFFAHDYPNERCSSEMIVTLPQPYRVLSNGRRLETSELDGGLWRWHYRQDQPHVAYLVSLVLGEFEIEQESWRGKPLEYWVPPGTRGDALRTFGKTGRMLELFSSVLATDYPYDKYSQAVVHLFAWGGMENTGATTLYETVLLSARAALDDDAEGLLAHELAHQWFGDMITCRSWSHLWLNEGFATYMEHVWDEHEYGPDAYAYGTWQRMRGVAESERDNRSVGLSAPYGGSPDDLFGRAASNPYSKGAAVIHALRRRLGDEAFWAAIRAYVEQHAWDEVESDDLRRVCEDISGLNLERFWAQWVHRGGAPELRVWSEWDAAGGALELTVEQQQEISPAAPAFALDVDVWLVDAAGTLRRRVLKVDGPSATLRIECPDEPAQVCFDPHAALLAVIDHSMLSTSMLLRTVRDGPTLPSRLSAVRAVAQSDRDDVRAALRDVLFDQEAHWGLRSEAAAALGRMNVAAARDILLRAVAPGRMSDYAVRRAVIAAVGTYRHPEVAAALRAVVQENATDRLVAEALAAIGQQEASAENTQILLAASQRHSRDDDVARAAVAALAKLGAAEGLVPARALARYGSPYRARPAGIAALGRLGGLAESPGEIRELLVGFLTDPQDKASEAAIDALLTFGDPNAVPGLERFAAGAGDPGRRRAARDAIAELSAADRPKEELADLRRRIDELEEQVRELEAALP